MEYFASNWSLAGFLAWEKGYQMESGRVTSFLVWKCWNGQMVKWSKWDEAQEELVIS